MLVISANTELKTSRGKAQHLQSKDNSCWMTWSGMFHNSPTLCALPCVQKSFHIKIHTHIYKWYRRWHNHVIKTSFSISVHIHNKYQMSLVTYEKSVCNNAESYDCMLFHPFYTLSTVKFVIIIINNGLWNL
jgi:hypothetical protein